MKEQPKHVPEMDFLRAFAILAVLAIHVSAGFTSIPQINALMVVNVGIDIFTHFAVPLFIFISGFLLYLKYNKNYSLKEFYLKRFWRIVPPYLVFTTFYLAFNAAIATLKAGVITLPSFLQIIYAYFAAGGYYHLWFFLIIIELYLFYPLIVKVYNFFADRKLGFLFLVISLILQLGWQIFGSNFQLHLLGYNLSITDKIWQKKERLVLQQNFPVQILLLRSRNLQLQSLFNNQRMGSEKINLGICNSNSNLYNYWKFSLVNRNFHLWLIQFNSRRFIHIL